MTFLKATILLGRPHTLVYTLGRCQIFGAVVGDLLFWKLFILVLLLDLFDVFTLGLSLVFTGNRFSK